MSTRWPPAAGAVLSDRFEIIKQAARDAHGNVLLALDKGDSSNVLVFALRKDLFEAARAATNGERLAAAATLTAKRLAAVIEVGDQDGNHFVVTQRPAGENLGATISKAGPPKPPVVLGVIKQLSGTVAAIHDAGGVHGSVSPATIFVGKSGVTVTAPWFLDGAARPGMSDWLAPEQRRPGAKTTPSCDVYGLGMVLGFLSGCKKPRGGKKLSDQGCKVSPELDEVFVTATSSRIGERYKSAGDFKQWALWALTGQGDKASLPAVGAAALAAAPSSAPAPPPKPAGSPPPGRASSLRPRTRPAGAGRLKLGDATAASSAKEPPAPAVAADAEPAPTRSDPAPEPSPSALATRPSAPAASPSPPPSGPSSESEDEAAPGEPAVTHEAPLSPIDPPVPTPVFAAAVAEGADTEIQSSSGQFGWGAIIVAMLVGAGLSAGVMALAGGSETAPADAAEKTVAAAEDSDQALGAATDEAPEESPASTATEEGTEADAEPLEEVADAGVVEDGDDAAADASEADTTAISDAPSVANGTASADAAATEAGPAELADAGGSPDAGQAAAPVVAVAAAAAAADGCPAAMARVTWKSGAAFCIDTHEYPGAGQIPMQNVSRVTATDTCAEAGKRLCELKEFTRSCGKTYPYGGRYRGGYCNVNKKKWMEPKPVATGSLPECVSKYGAYDLVGNMAEWTAEGFVAGGHFRDSKTKAICRRAVKPVNAKKTFGFRCCADAQ